MSKKPWPVNANSSVLDSLVFMQWRASSITTLIACVDSGDGIMPSDRMNILAASNASTWLTANVLSCFSFASTLIVGDSEMDVQCGKNAIAKTCAVTYGYRTEEELKQQKPDFIIDNLAGLKEIIDYSSRWIIINSDIRLLINLNEFDFLSNSIFIGIFILLLFELETCPLTWKFLWYFTRWRILSTLK